MRKLSVSVILLLWLTASCYPWAIQPKNRATPNWAHPLARDLAMLIYPETLNGPEFYFAFYHDDSERFTKITPGTAWEAADMVAKAKIHTPRQVPDPDDGFTPGLNGPCYSDPGNNRVKPNTSFQWYHDSNVQGVGTVVLWSRTDAAGSAFVSLGDWDIAGPDYGFAMFRILSGTYRAAFYVDTGAAANAMDSDNYPDYRWVCLAGQYDGNQVRLYKDGGLAGTGATSGQIDPITPAITFAIGGRGGGTYEMPGYLGEVRIYTRVLSQEEMAQIAMMQYEEFKHDQPWLAAAAAGVSGQVIRIQGN